MYFLSEDEIIKCEQCVSWWLIEDLKIFEVFESYLILVYEKTALDTNHYFLKTQHEQKFQRQLTFVVEPFWKYLNFF